MYLSSSMDFSAYTAFILLLLLLPLLILERQEKVIMTILWCLTGLLLDVSLTSHCQANPHTFRQPPVEMFSPLILPALSEFFSPPPPPTHTPSFWCLSMPGALSRIDGFPSCHCSCYLCLSTFVVDGDFAGLLLASSHQPCHANLFDTSPTAIPFWTRWGCSGLKIPPTLPAEC